MNTQQTIRDLQSIAKQLRNQPDRNGKLETAVTNIYCAVAMINDWEAQPQQPADDSDLAEMLGFMPQD